MAVARRLDACLFRRVRRNIAFACRYPEAMEEAGVVTVARWAGEDPKMKLLVGLRPPKSLFAKTNARSSTILRDELDAGLFESGFDLCQRIEPNFQLTFHRLNALNGLQRDFSGFG
jgi:hypothetical protein